MINFYDFEVYPKLWCVTIINPYTKEESVIVNDKEKLEKYYNAHKKEIWCGYNSRNYDSWILKGILCGFDPYDISKFIISGGKGFEYSSLLKKYTLYDYDTMDKFNSLKTLEAFMGNDIRETEISFDYDGEFTPEMIEQVLRYNLHDVEQTIEVFMRKKADFQAHIDLIKNFNLPMSYISKTQAQLSAIILDCKRQSHDDEWDIQFVPTLKIERYRHVLDWFKDYSNYDYKKSLKVDVCGIPHMFGWGGIHGCQPEPIHRKGCIIHVDVTSYYPSIMIEYGFLTRNCKEPNKFKQIYDKRVQLKKEGKKKEQAPYKIILNSTYGICKDPHSLAYDPRQANNVCVNGQLMLLDLLEHLEGHCEILQSNTDGLIIQIEDTDEAFNTVDDICYEWEQRTHMSLGFDIIDEIWQGDVNNYVFHFQDKNEYERKGAYVKELSDLDNDLPIVNTAIVEFMTKGVPVEDTVCGCHDLSQFQKIVKISSKYLNGVHNGQTLTDKTFRVFASKDTSDTSIYKVKAGKNPEKFANTPINCFIANGKIAGEEVPEKLDRNWYIDIAKKRLKEKFNIES